MSDEPQQTIFRSVKNKDFTTFSNSLLRDARLSFKARGVLAMCLSMPPEWKVYRNWLVEQGQEGREAVQGALQELERHGYVKYIEVRRGGQFVSSVWEFHEVPVSDRTNRTNWTYPPLNGKPSDGKPSTGNPSPKKDDLKEDIQKEEQKAEFSLTSEKKKKPRTGTITESSRPSQSDIETFCSSISLPSSDGEAMFLHFEEKGWAKFKNWQAVIRKWKAFGYLPSQKTQPRNGNSAAAFAAPKNVTMKL